MFQLRKREKFTFVMPFCSVQAISGLGDNANNVEGTFPLFSLLIERLILLVITLTDTPEIMFLASLSICLPHQTHTYSRQHPCVPINFTNLCYLLMLQFSLVTLALSG